ncbi:MAG: amidohydrolase [Halobacteriales archaeon]|nr:amidohydrolase [Halobacteriales archaeon]
MSKAAVYESIEDDRERLIELARTIWDNPELSLEEYESAAWLQEALGTAGFEIETGVAGMETAFVARYGDGDPVIGTLGEFDALPDLSQRRSADREPIEEGAPGHGCGHNLFGVASLGGAIAIKRAIERGEISGTVVYYGTPAEEIGVGKPFMVEAGAFEDVDAIISWHPGWYNSASKGSCLAVDSLVFEFTGEASHAGAAPEAGRSALDAVQLMNMGVEFMREHVPDDARIHYAIENAGAAPNVVDPEASVWYYVRAPERSTVKELSAWVREIADGAATMTQTEVDVDFRGGNYNVLSNNTLADVIEDTMFELDGFEFTGDAELAADLRDSLGDVSSQVDRLPEAHATEAADAAMYTDAVETHDDGVVGSYSTDTGSVSWNVPVGRFRAATWPVGTPAHSWQAVAASGSVGLDAAVFAAKVIAGSMYELFTDEATLEAAIEEFEAERATMEYEVPLPEDADPYEMNA